MHRKLLFAGAILLVAALAAMAADAVTGKWRMEQEGFGGGPTRVSTFDLKADGATLTGTLTQPGFGPPGDAPPPPTTTPISNGKVDGNNISFDVAMTFGDNSLTMKYAGAITGSDMKVTITVPGFQGGDPRTIEATAKKQ
jgi:hypothetical protein